MSSRLHELVNKILMNTHSQLEAAEKALTSTFAKIDTKVKKNLQRVLRAFRDHKVGPHHFSGVTGYGHDDLGRQVLDRVFAQVMGAEACLLYTSPSPRDLSTSRMPSSA